MLYKNKLNKRPIKIRHVETMGAGNPLIRSFDPEKYQASTYFIDFSDMYEDAETAVKESWDDEYEYKPFEELTEDEINEEFDRMLGHDVNDFRENFFDEYHLPDEDKQCIEELSAEYRGYGYVIAESDNAYILSTADSENHHYAIGMVPKFKYDDIFQELHDEHEDKWEWYQNRNKDYDEMVTGLADKEYNRQLKAFKKENEPTMRKLHQVYSKGMSSRNGAWTSCSIKKIGRDFKFL